jgi:hypothetical protein
MTAYGFWICCEFARSWATGSLSRRLSSKELVICRILSHLALPVDSCFDCSCKHRQSNLGPRLCLLCDWLYEVKLDLLRNELDCRPLSGYLWHDAYNRVYRQLSAYICSVGCVLSRRTRYAVKTMAESLPIVPATHMLWFLILAQCFELESLVRTQRVAPCRCFLCCRYRIQE